MRKRQTGITFIGWLVVLIPAAIVGYAAIRLVPKYLNYVAVSRSLSQLAGDFKGDPQVTMGVLKTSLGKHFDVESIEFPSVDDIRFSHEDGFWVVEANYQESVPLFAGISVSVDFDKRVQLK